MENAQFNRSSGGGSSAFSTRDVTSLVNPSSNVELSPTHEPSYRAHCYVHEAPLGGTPEEPSPEQLATLRSIYSLDSRPEPRPGWTQRVRVPLKAVLVVVLCVFAVGPAVTLWMIS
eukprot:RCo010299